MVTATTRLTDQSAWGWAFIALLAGAPVLALYGLNPWGFNPSVALASVYQVGLAVLLLWALSTRLRLGALALAWRRDSLLRPLGWLFAWACLSTLWAHNHYEAALKLLLWAAALLCASLVVAWPAQQRQLRCLIATVFAVGAVLAAYGIVQIAYGIAWPASDHLVSLSKYTAPILFGNQNHASQYLLLSWPLGLVLLARSRPSPGFALSWWSAISLYFACLLLARSLSAQLALIVQLIFVLFFWRRQLSLRPLRDFVVRRHARQLLAAVFLLLGVVLLSSPELRGLLARIHLAVPAELWEKWQFLRQPELQLPHRVAPWLNTLPMIRDHILLGVGIGNWTVFYPDYQGAVWWDQLSFGMLYRYQNAHNDYLEIFAELGLVGMALALWAILRLLRIWWPLRGGADGLLIVGPVGFAVLADYSFPMVVPGSLVLLLLHIALLERSRLAAVDEAPGVGMIGTMGFGHRLAIATAALCLLGVSVFQYRMYRAERLHLSALATYDQKIQDFQYAAGAVASIATVVAVAVAGEWDADCRVERHGAA